MPEIPYDRPLQYTVRSLRCPIVFRKYDIRVILVYDIKLYVFVFPLLIN